ncbi:Phospholipase B [Giardia muris]|uniref:Phospholipase B-like n=1 Tax=Giardia muris TaxID=5742 RepID=A0A4Z1SXX8_GIAMU|nr:Phospholipase B [Giardia muris]|eukprot:TNJ30612.1 Phospholipase B [Giardia muris]
MVLWLIGLLLGELVQHCVRYHDGGYTVEVVTDKPDSGCVVITTSDTSLAETGWMHFNATTNGDYANTIQMRAVGFAEGYLFHESLHNHFMNMKDWYLKSYLHADKYPPELEKYMQENLDWTREAAYEFGTDDSFWRHVGYTLDHFDGVVSGYGAAAEKDKELSELELWIYFSSGDLLDIASFITPELVPKYEEMTPEERQDYALLRSRCSGLVRVTDRHLFVGHTAWFFYGAMTRVFKEYTLNLDDSSLAATTFTFSSYPGFSYSFDDWISTSAGLIITETTANVFDTTLYDHCKPQSVFAWVRSQVASRMASTGLQWQTIYQRYNSGTYNNQWLVVDLKVFDRYGTDASRDLLWVSEQMPGRVVIDDATETLRNNGNYYGSYNIPSYYELWVAAGYPDVAANDSTLDYEKAPRSHIFARDAPSIDDVEAMKAMMRYNRWTTDPLSIAEGQQSPDPSNAIASRYDMRTDPERAKAFGGIDSKVADYNRYTGALTAHIISGPTADDQEAWDFTKSKLFCPRRGLIDGPYRHDWQEFSMPADWMYDP